MLFYNFHSDYVPKLAKYLDVGLLDKDDVASFSKAVKEAVTARQNPEWVSSSKSYLIYCLSGILLIHKCYTNPILRCLKLLCLIQGAAEFLHLMGMETEQSIIPDPLRHSYGENQLITFSIYGLYIKYTSQKWPQSDPGSQTVYTTILYFYH